MVRAIFKSYFRELVVTKIFLKLLRRVVGDIPRVMEGFSMKNFE